MLCIRACFVSLSFAGLVVLARSLNPIPSRTRPLNSSAPMVLWLKPWESRSLPDLPRTRHFLFTCHDQTKRRFPSGRRRFCVYLDEFVPNTRSRRVGRCSEVGARDAGNSALLPTNAGIVLRLPKWSRPMKPFILHSLVRVALIAIALVLPGVAAAQPNLEMHRVGVTADDGLGWHLAVSSQGSFSILVPIPFNDFTTRDAATGEATYVVGGKSSEGIKFAAVELAPGAKAPPELASIPKTFAATAGNE